MYYFYCDLRIYDIWTLIFWFNIEFDVTLLDKHLNFEIALRFYI